MEHDRSAGSKAVNPDTRTVGAAPTHFPQFPGEDCLAHAATLYIEQAEAYLISRGLLIVARGEIPQSVKQIVDVDLSQLPALPQSHPGYDRRLETRIKIKAQNAANKMKRRHLLLTDWTEVYTLLKVSTETTAAVFSRELKDECDLFATRKMEGGYFDGPRAWRMTLLKLKGGQRSKADKEFYRAAERAQRASHLADGCRASDYSQKAHAFLVHINPNLAQPYDATETTDYLLDLMPNALRGDARLIKHELSVEGRLTDHLYVVSKCRAVVHDEQRGAPPTPTFVLTPDFASFDLSDLIRTTGMLLALPAGLGAVGRGIAPAAGDGAALVANNEKYCDDCPHITPRSPNGAECFQSPNYEGPPPPSVYCDAPRWRGILAGKAANARRLGVENKVVTPPSKADIDAYKKRQKAKRERRSSARNKDKGDKDKTPGTPTDRPALPAPAGGVAASNELDDWRASLVELSEAGGVALDACQQVECSKDNCGCTVDVKFGTVVDSMRPPMLVAGEDLGELDEGGLDDASEHEFEDAEDDDAEDDAYDEPEDKVKHWFVLVPIVDGASCDLLYLDNPAYLSYDESTHSHVAFGQDEAGARQFADSHTAPPSPVAPSAPSKQPEQSSGASATAVLAPVNVTKPTELPPGISDDSADDEPPAVAPLTVPTGHVLSRPTRPVVPPSALANRRPPPTPNPLDVVATKAASRLK